MEAQIEQAIARCQSGDTAAFGELYDAPIKKIYEFIFYKTLHKETAEDLTSVAFTKALANINSFSGGSFQAWLYRIARNTVIDHYRTRKQERDIDDVWDLSGDDDIERDADARAKIEKVQEYLKELPAVERDIIVMRVWQDMTHAEIAEVLGKSEGAVKVAYSRAMKDLRKNVTALVALIAFLSTIRH